MSTHHTTVVVIGAGPAGLATSRHLTGHGIDHVVLERGQLAQSWRSERWDSLRLLTPSWMNRLPGDDAPTDPDGFLTAGELVARLDRYSQQIASPILEHTTVTALRRSSGRPVTRRRTSGLIAGIASDAAEITDHLRRQLDRSSTAA